MDQRTADSLFGTGDDSAADFFADNSVTQEEPTASESLEHSHDYTTTQNYEQHQDAQQSNTSYDPYGQLKSTPTVRSQTSSQGIPPTDPYAPHTNGYQPQVYTPSVTSSPPSTYTAPAAHASTADPYASISARPTPKQTNYSPYTPAPNYSPQTYAPATSYAPPANAYNPLPSLDVPKPPPPTSIDVSKYRSTPNAYDPPIRTTPVAKPRSSYSNAPAPPFGHNPAGAPYQRAPVNPPPSTSPGYFPPGAVHGQPPMRNTQQAPPPHNLPPLPRAGSIPPPHVARAMSPYAPNPNVPPPPSSVPPPPRPSSTSSNRSVNNYARPPSTTPSAGTHSRPTSAASVTRQTMKSPPRAPSAATRVSEPLLAVAESELTPRPEFTYNESLDMESDPTPRVPNMTGANDYLQDRHVEEAGIEEPYPPPETDEIVENLHNRTSSNASNASQPKAMDPYAPIQRPANTEPARSSSFTAPPPPVQHSVPPPAPKSVPPPPKANPYAPRSTISPPPPKSGLTPSSSFSDRYGPGASLIPPPAPAQPISMLAAVDPSPIIDLSHSPPNQRVPISHDPYNAVGQASRRSTMSEESHLGLTRQPAPPPPAGYHYAPPPIVAEPPMLGSPQYVSAPAAPAVPSAYAPSPSLLGTNDPLGRASVRVPIFSFGFGGRVVSCFHNNPGMGAFDGMAPGRPSTALTVKLLKDVVPTSAYDVTEGSFPGPLFNDQGPGGATSVLQTTGAAIKAKKTALLQWLDSRITEAEGGFMYVGTTGGEAGAAAKAEGKVVLLKLLKIWVENDGKLSGSPAIDEAIKTTLLGPASEVGTLGGAPAPAFAYAMNGPVSSVYGDGGREPVVASYQVKASTLDQIQDLLLRGDRKQAYRVALDARLWAHALLISRGLDEESWKEVAHEFIKMELTPPAGADNSLSIADNRESLRLAYGLFAGDGPAALKLLIPPKQLGMAVQGLGGQFPNGPLLLDQPATEATSVPDHVWVQWKKLLAATISNQPPGNTNATTALGDYLMANNWVEAAHCCYMLSLGTSLFTGVGAPGVRAILFGSANPSVHPSFRADLSSILFSEVAEFAMSLLPTVKGQEPFHGVQHLQAYRFWHATCLAEMGEITLAKRYTDAIGVTMRSNTRGSPYFTTTFLQQLEELQDRLIEAPHADKTKAWISKPTVRSFNNWLTGGLEKLIQGDELPQGEEASQGKKSLEITPQVGPFSHYSSISSATPSTHPSPSPSFANLHSASSSIGRSGSAAGMRPPPTHAATLPAPPPPPRAASAVDFSKGRASPIAKPSSAGAAVTSFPNRYQPPSNPVIQTPGTQSTAPEASEDAPKPLYATWWGESNDTDGVTPTATTFMSNDGDGGNFISLMDTDQTLVPSSSASTVGKNTSQRVEMDDDLEDLGFGNSKKPKKEDVDNDMDGEAAKKDSPTASKAPTPAPQAAQPAQDPGAAPAKGWFSWIRRSDSTPKPVRAKLGEENAFYYDENLKKWVNKRAGAEAATGPSVPPPPPARAQTASPSRAGIAVNTATPPPPRAASVVQPPPPHSGLAPPSRPSSSLSAASTDSPLSVSDSAPPSRGSPAPQSGMPPPPRALGQTPPPPSGSASPAGSVRSGAKRNPRSRYVDVFQAS